MPPNRSRASSGSNTRIQAPNASKQQNMKQQRTVRANNASQADCSPTPMPARAAKVGGNRTEKRTPSTTVTAEEIADIIPVKERYLNNLRMLKRRDTHITSIFDQFAHVTVYYTDDDEKMQRAGYEGTLFFFERDIEPMYGFYILNRQGMSDYIRYLGPNDIIDPVGDMTYVSSLDSTVLDVMGDKDKTAGFWAMRMDVREPLGDMMMRLLSCIRSNKRYPDDFRYGPDRPVPQQIVFEGERAEVTYDFIQGLSEEARKKVLLTLQAEKKKAEAEQGLSSGSECSPTKAASNPQQTIVNGHTQSAPNVPPSSSNMSELDLLFSKLAPSAPPARIAPQPTVNLAPPPPPSQQPVSGKSLLDSLFASVSTPAFPAAPTTTAGQKLTLEQLGLTAPAVGSVPMSMEIASPKPSAAGMPQILNRDVIHDIMGHPRPASRSTSRMSASTANTQSPTSAGARRNKDLGYVADTGEDDAILSEASVTVDRDHGNTGQRTAAGVRQAFLASNSSSVKGDATPRARAGQLGRASPPTRVRPAVSHSNSETSATTLGSGPSPAPNGVKRQPALTDAGSRTVSAPSQIRQAFQSGSDIWANGGFDSGKMVTPRDARVEAEADIEEVPELDFSEIGMLDDSRMFDSKRNTSNTRAVVAKGKAKVNGAIHNTPAAPTIVNGTPGNPKLSSASVPTTPEAPRSKTQKTPRAAMPNGHSASVHDVQVIDARADVVDRSIRSALLGTGLVRADGQTLDRNAFVREVLTLVHTDKSFVDKMYQSYVELLSSTS